MPETPPYLRQPRRLATWQQLGIGTGTLTALSVLADVVVRVAGAPYELFTLGIACAAILAVITALAYVGGVILSNQQALAEEHAALFQEQVGMSKQMSVLIDVLAENTAEFKKLSQRVAELADPDRVEWRSYAQAAADILGVDPEKVVVPFPGGRKN